MIMNTYLLETGIHPFAAEWFWSFKAADRNDQKAMQACSSLILAGWGRGEANLGKDECNRCRTISSTMQSNTTIVCNQQVSTGQFRVTVDGQGRVKRSKLIGELNYDDPRIFNHTTSVLNFTAQLGKLISVPPGEVVDYGIMHNDNSSHSFLNFIGEYLINKTLSNPSTLPPSFEDAQQAL